MGQSRTVVAENLPKDHSVESVEELFGKVGPVKMVRICSPEAANGANSTAAKHPKTDMLVSNKVRGCLFGMVGGGMMWHFSSEVDLEWVADGCLVLVQLHALVEYESVELAEKAVSILDGLHCWCGTVLAVWGLEGGR